MPVPETGNTPKQKIGTETERSAVLVPILLGDTKGENMRPLTAQAVPINPGNLAFLSSPQLGRNATIRGYGSGCDCGPAGGCRCSGGLSAYDPGRAVFVRRSGMHGMGQNVSLDQLIANGFSWLTGALQTAAGPSAAVPTGVSSVGATVTNLMQYLPYFIGGYIVYKLVK